MTIEIQTVYDKERLCGWRKPGGFYFVAGKDFEQCELLPAFLHECETCGSWLKFSRAWQWITLGRLKGLAQIKKTCAAKCQRPCWADERDTLRVGLLWIGVKHYPSAESWFSEAEEQGISRRINVLPANFKPEDTWIFFAHTKKGAFPPTRDFVRSPAIVAAVRPAIQYVVAPDDSEKRLEKLVKRGVQLVRVERAQMELFGKGKQEATNAEST